MAEKIRLMQGCQVKREIFLQKNGNNSGFSDADKVKKWRFALKNSGFHTFEIRFTALQDRQKSTGYLRKRNISNQESSKFV